MARAIGFRSLTHNSGARAGNARFTVSNAGWMVCICGLPSGSNLVALGPRYTLIGGHNMSLEVYLDAEPSRLG
jgi:hypothetical protein